VDRTPAARDQRYDVLSAITFGQRIAEDEGDALSTYFVETEQWQNIYAGHVDVVYGAKGSGKSAIYSLLLSREDALFDRGILVTAAENPRGATVFKDLVADPPASENEFRGLWKLYILILIAAELRDYDLKSDPAKQVISALEDAGLLTPQVSLRSTLRAVLDYVRRVLDFESIEASASPDAHSGLPSVSGKITLREPSPTNRNQGAVSADDLLELCNQALAAADLRVWVLLDRLDVAFAESEELELHALRALFRTYRDFSGWPQISIKIFLRSDIWNRITSEGFREGSHVTRHVTINWQEQTLLNLVIRRALRNELLREYYAVNEDFTLADVERQRELFYRIFPDQVDAGTRRSSTIDWMLSRTRDGSRDTAPRELIHLLSSAQQVQLQRWEVGSADPGERALFDRSAVKEALPEVSRVRLEQTLYSEYPTLRPFLRKLESQKTEQTADTLARIWEVPADEASITASRLVEIGFFERRTSGDQATYWVPFLYRDALNMVQGIAD
jgi:hypothetical protein